MAVTRLVAGSGHCVSPEVCAVASASAFSRSAAALPLIVDGPSSGEVRHIQLVVPTHHDLDWGVCDEGAADAGEVHRQFFGKAVGLSVDDVLAPSDQTLLVGGDVCGVLANFARTR